MPDAGTNPHRAAGSQRQFPHDGQPIAAPRFRIVAPSISWRSRNRKYGAGWSAGMPFPVSDTRSTSGLAAGRIAVLELNRQIVRPRAWHRCHCAPGSAGCDRIPVPAAPWSLHGPRFWFPPGSRSLPSARNSGCLVCDGGRQVQRLRPGGRLVYGGGLERRAEICAESSSDVTSPCPRSTAFESSSIQVRPLPATAPELRSRSQ